MEQDLYKVVRISDMKATEIYLKSINKLVKKFCKKQGFNFESVSSHDIYVGFVNLADMCITFDVIYFDLLYQAKKGLIIDWYWNHFIDSDSKMNYRQYLLSKTKFA